MADKQFPLNTGAKIPAIGLGTWQSPAGEVKAAVLHALKSGYRHIDCAYGYFNEPEVGEALKEAFASGICKREDVFVTTKLWCTYHSRAELALEKSLKNLDLEYIDLLLMHWPVPWNPNGNDPNFPTNADGVRDLDNKNWDHLKTWKLMEQLPRSQVRAIGVSNYSVSYLEELLKIATTVPAVNQIENHPYLPQQEIVDFCHAKGIHVTAYSPFGSTGSPLWKEEAVVALAKKKGVSEGTLLLSFQVSRGNSTAPKSVTPARIAQNFEVVKLDAGDLEALMAIPKTKGVTRYVCPPMVKMMGGLGFPDTTA